MTKQKSTKRALLLSALALLVCLTMLVGSTFAWFTDSVTSSSNLIKSGNLDVEAQYTLDGENWADLADADDLFQKSLWEPGHTEVVAIRIQNKGTLALKYAASMNIINEVVGKTKGGDDIVLSDVLTVSTLIQQVNQFGDIAVSLAFSGENKVAYQNTAAFNAGNVLGTNVELAPGDAHYVIVKVDMAQTVGNEANHDGVHVPTINFGINIVATQFTYESDSFGNQYDKDASLDGAVLEYGGIIDLEEDVTEEVAIQEGANVTLNMNDNTLSNSLTNNGNVTVSGGTIQATGENAVYNEGTAKLEDVTLNMTGSTGYITNSRTDGSVTIYENVTATSSGGGVNVWEGEAIFKSGAITTNSTSTSARHVFYVANGAKLTIEDGEFTFNPTNLTRKGSYICAQENATVIVNGGIFHKPSTRTAPIQAVDGSTVLIYGGTFQFDPSAFVAPGYVAVEANGWWTVSAQ